MQQFKRFCLVGCFGFAVDSVSFLLLERLIDNPLAVRLFAFWLAATATWLGNSLITWCDENTPLSLARWCRYMLSCHLSGAINLLVFWLCLGNLHLYIGFCLGISAGLASNYFMASRFVFINQAKSVDIS